MRIYQNSEAVTAFINNPDDMIVVSKKQLVSLAYFARQMIYIDIECAIDDGSDYDYTKELGALQEVLNLDLTVCEQDNKLWVK